MFNKNAKSTILQISVKGKLDNSRSLEDRERFSRNYYTTCINGESLKDCYKIIKSDFHAYKAENNSSIEISIKGQFKGVDFKDKFSSIDLFRNFLIETELADSKDLDNIDHNIRPCLVM